MTFSDRFSILIADDDDLHRSTLQEIFEPRGYRTLLAADGREALILIEHEPVHCLLLDVHMPGLTGIETLRQVRQVRATLPCIFLTGDNNEQLKHQARLLRAFSVLDKPISREVITITVRRALESAYPPA